MRSPPAPATLSQVLERVRLGEPLSLPVLVAVNADAAVVAGDDESTGVTGVNPAPGAWSVDAMQHLGESACLVVDGFAATGGGLRLSVGRSRRCDYRIADGSVSAVHAHLSYDIGRGEYSVVDAGSRNGTFVNSARLAPQTRAAVWPGSLLGFGLVVYCFLDPPMVRKLASLAGE